MESEVEFLDRIQGPIMQFLKNAATIEGTKYNRANWVTIENHGIETSQVHEMDLGNDKTENQLTTSTEWITADTPFCESILKAFCDFDKKRILNMISETPLTIPEILHRCKMPSTSGYRKINSLVREGIIVPLPFISVQNTKKEKKYVSIIEDANIYIDKENIKAKVRWKNQNTITVHYTNSTTSGSKLHVSGGENKINGEYTAGHSFSVHTS
jgi:hypothetical protein